MNEEVLFYINVIPYFDLCSSPLLNKNQGEICNKNFHPCTNPGNIDPALNSVSVSHAFSRGR